MLMSSLMSSHRCVEEQTYNQTILPSIILHMHVQPRAREEIKLIKKSSAALEKAPPPLQHAKN